MKLDLQFFGTPDFSKQRTAGLRKSIQSFKNIIQEHENKIINPRVYYPEWDAFDSRYQEGLKRHWRKEIHNLSEQLEAAEQELKRRST